MAKKPVRSKQTPNTQSAEDCKQSRIAPTEKQDKCQGAPIENDHGEATGKRVVEQGDLDEETLDPAAPYNRTYGSMKK